MDDKQVIDPIAVGVNGSAQKDCILVGVYRLPRLSSSPAVGGQQLNDVGARPTVGVLG